MTAFSALAPADFQAAVLRLFPRGRAWLRDLGGVLAGYAGGIGDALFRLHVASVQLLDAESLPARTLRLLPEFEADYGLPDSCSPGEATLVQRRAALLAKMQATGGQSAAYYIGVARALGYAVTITTWKPFELGRTPLGSPLASSDWRFAWRVNAPQVTVRRFTLGQSALGEPLWSIGNTELQCRLAKIQPAHGVLWFQYS